MASPRLDRRAAAGAAEDRAGGGAGTGVAAARRGRSDDPDRSVRGQGGAGPGDRPGRHLGDLSFTCAWHTFLSCEAAATWEVGLIRRVAILLVDRRFVRCHLNITGARKACGDQRPVSGAAGWVGGASAAEPCR